MLTRFEPRLVRISTRVFLKTTIVVELVLGPILLIDRLCFSIDIPTV